MSHHDSQLHVFGHLRDAEGKKEKTAISAIKGRLQMSTRKNSATIFS
jgi:hypothetical protein